jgi:aryl-alcohol dehydrogenase-like predicted oxidoreductase
MRYRILGRSGLRVSELCLGTMTFGGAPGRGASPEAGRRIVDRYAEAGGNFIDTANKYTGGASETILGEALEGRRDEFVLATKYTLQMHPGQVNASGNHRKNLVRSLEESLRRLRTDHIDLYWVHARDALTPVEELMRALDDQVRLGKVLHVGVSDWPAWEVSAANTLAALRGWSPFVGLQIRYSLLERTVERDLVPMARAYELPVLAWSPLGGGALTGKYLEDSAHPETGQGRLANAGPTDPQTERVVRETVAVAAEVGAEPSQVALAWLCARPGTVIPIVGATKEDHLDQNLGCLEVALSPEQLARLDAASAVDLGFPHEFLRSESVLRIVYGDRRADVDGVPA